MLDKKNIIKKEEDEEELASTPIHKPQKPKTYGKVVYITEKYIVLDVNGTGQRMKYEESKHSQLKKDDEIEI